VVGLDPVEEAEIARDRAMVRAVRRRLVLWSSGVTLLILLVLGTVLYGAVARSLAATGTEQLEVRARAIEESMRRPIGGPPLGMAFGGRSSGTIAFLVGPSGGVVGPPDSQLPDGLPDMASIEVARATGRDVRTEVIAEVPVRILSDDIRSQRGTFVVQVVADRTAEQQTLGVLAVVLIGGGLMAVLVATGFGAIYARRALVPIRESLDAQRVALRRQREFAADASHELRTPLTVIRASVEHLGRHRDEPVASVGTALDDIGAETDHLTRLVDDLLLLARSDSGVVELERLPVDLAEIAADATASLAPTAAERSIKLAVLPAPAVMIGDPTRLRQLFVILVDNAIRHSPSEGTVRVAIRPDGSRVVVTVEDDGPGFQEADIPHLFERFWRAPDAPDGGTGLGLSIAAWIVERHGGSIEGANVETGGARFTISLPAATAAPEAGPAVTPELS
jgi:signal transduction histidine kinase